MEPNIFVRGEQPSKLGTNDANDVSQHGDENKATVKGKNKASTTRSPNRVPESVQSCQPLVDILYMAFRIVN